MPSKRLVEHILPANNIRFIEKAAASNAEIIFLDLEDALASTAKVAARKILIDAVRSTDFGGKEVYIRPNNLRTKWAAGDYYYAVKPLTRLIKGVVLAKTIGLEDVSVVDQILTALEREADLRSGFLKIEALIELPRALMEVDSIAEYIAKSGRAGSLILGFVDYLASSGGKPQAQEEQFIYFSYPKKKIIEAAKKWGLDAFDGITIHAKNYEATKKDAILSAKMGFTGKWSLHPEQIRAIDDADKEEPFCESRVVDLGVISKAKPYLLEDLKRLAENEKPLLAPIDLSKKKTKARRSLWISSKEAPRELDEYAPTVISVDRVEELRELFKRASGGVFVRIKTEGALANAYDLAKASPLVEGLIFDIPGKSDDLEAKGALIAACSAADVDAIDGPSEAGKAESQARHAAILGFCGKVALTSSEARLYNQIFSPSIESIERALEIVELYHKADKQRGLGAIVYRDRRRPNAPEELVDAATMRVERRVLALAEKANLFTQEQAERYFNLRTQTFKTQEMSQLLDALEREDAFIRKAALRELYLLGSAFVEPIWKEWRSHAQLAKLIFGAPTVGIALRRERFERLRKVWKLPLSPVPKEHKVLEFTIHDEDCHVDVLTSSGDEGPLTQFLAKHGEGIQQVELLTSDVEKAIKILQDIGLKPIYEKAKVGSRGALVNFVLASTAFGKKILVELVQEK